MFSFLLCFPAGILTGNWITSCCIFTKQLIYHGHIISVIERRKKTCSPNVSQCQNYKYNYTSGTCQETSSSIPTSLHPGKCERSSLCSIPPCSSVHGTIILYNVVVPLSGTAFDCMITSLKYTSFHFIFHRHK